MHLCIYLYFCIMVMRICRGNALLLLIIIIIVMQRRIFSHEIRCKYFFYIMVMEICGGNVLSMIIIQMCNFIAKWNANIIIILIMRTCSRHLLIITILIQNSLFAC